MATETLDRSVQSTANRPKVFISYSRKDLAFAQMLVDALGERGFDAFLDKTDIAPGPVMRSNASTRPKPPRKP